MDDTTTLQGQPLIFIGDISRVARAIGVDGSHLSRVLRGKARLSLIACKALSVELAMPMDDLYILLDVENATTWYQRKHQTVEAT